MDIKSPGFLFYQVVPTYLQMTVFRLLGIKGCTWDFVMTTCPNCGTEVPKPDKMLKNHAFKIESYTCKNCHFKFKITY
jgi:predicted RNA-binding Zn-ribbon protein involved in translation (DUF1610 family)